MALTHLQETIDNAILEDNETVVVALIGTDDSDVTIDPTPGANAAIVTITDNDSATIAIAANDAAAAEPSNDGQLTVTMSHASDKDTVVNYAITGTANGGTDYTALSGTVTIVAGATSATINVDTMDDTISDIPQRPAHTVGDDRVASYHSEIWE